VCGDVAAYMQLVAVNIVFCLSGLSADYFYS